MSITTSHKHFATILTFALAGLVALSPFAIDTYLVAMPSMANYFGREINVIELTVTLYFLGFAIGNFFGGPLSDSFGRKTIAITGIIIYGIASLLIAISPKIEFVIILRVIQAFGGGFATVTANVFIRDWYSGKQVARMITIMSMIMMLGPLFAPVIGTLIFQAYSWKGIFVFLALFAAIILLIISLIVPESRDKALITKTINKGQLLDKYKIFFSDKPSVLLLFTVGFSMSGMFVFLTSASFIYMDYFDVPENRFAILFGSNVLLNITLSLLNTILLKYYIPRHILHVGLVIQLLAGITLATVVLLGHPSLTAVFSCIVVFLGSLGLIFGNGSAAILNINPKVSGSANATIGILRFLLSFVIGSAIALFHTNNLIPVGIAMFCCSLIANVLYFCFKRNAQAVVVSSK